MHYYVTNKIQYTDLLMDIDTEASMYQFVPAQSARELTGSRLELPSGFVLVATLNLYGCGKTADPSQPPLAIMNLWYSIELDMTNIMISEDPKRYGPKLSLDLLEKVRRRLLEGINERIEEVRHD